MITKDIRFRLGIVGIALITLGAIFAPTLSIDDATPIDLSQRLIPALSENHWLGTDLKGVDVWSSLLFGARISLLMSLLTAMSMTLVGTLLGLIAGFYRGIIEQILMRLIDLLSAFPGILLPLSLASLMRPTPLTLTLTLMITGWTSSARIIRAETLTLKEREFILAAESLGLPSRKVLFRHLFPQMLPIMLTQMTSALSSVLLAESSLSFLGLGPSTPLPTWGQLLNEGRTVIHQAPLLTLAPGFLIFLYVISTHFLSEALQDYFDPKRSYQGR